VSSVRGAQLALLVQSMLLRGTGRRPVLLGIGVTALGVALVVAPARGR
jgi:hypothetical protein